MSAAVDRVPLVDMSPFVEGSETGKQDVARRIAETGETIGCAAQEIQRTETGKKTKKVA